MDRPIINPAVREMTMTNAMMTDVMTDVMIDAVIDANAREGTAPGDLVTETLMIAIAEIAEKNHPASETNENNEINHAATAIAESPTTVAIDADNSNGKKPSPKTPNHKGNIPSPNYRQNNMTRLMRSRREQWFRDLGMSAISPPPTS